MACFSIPGAIKAVPIAATEVFLRLPPLHLQLYAEATIAIYRLYCSHQWKPKSESSGHAYMSQGMKEDPILQMGTDRMIVIHVCDKLLAVTFPDRSEWKDRVQPDRKGGLIWYTDDSKTNKGIVVGVYGYGTRQKLSFILFSYYGTVLYISVKWLKYTEFFSDTHC
jgi:hypothetical protein